MNDQDKKLLLELARESIKTYFSGTEPDVSKAKHLNKKQGVFVTLHKKKDLRGCIGFPHPTHALYHAVVEAARSAAFGDPRFPPVIEDEFKDIDIEISVLTVPELIEVKKPEEYLKKIKIGEDGLILKGDEGSGLLLPQVAPEQGWNVTEFLNGLSQKAGYMHEAWKNLDFKIYRFQAIIFSEKK